MKTLTFSILWILAPVNIFAASLSWNGSVSNLWSVAANWTPNAVPQNGDSLSFFDTGDPGGFYTMNDLPASNIYSSVQVGRFHEVTGNLVRVTTVIYGTFDAPVQAMGNLTGGAPTVTSEFNSFDVNGYDVFAGNAKFDGAVTGTGSIRGGVLDAPHGGLVFSANGTFSGAVINDPSGTMQVNADLGSASFQGGFVSGVGRCGPLTAAVSPGPNGGVDATGILTTGNLTLGNDTVDIDGPGTAYDQLKAIGSVNIQSGSLQLRAIKPVAGQTLVIIDNDGGDPVVGTFSNAPEGTTIQSVDGLSSFRISYHGGDGNDVALTTLTPPASVSMTHSPSSSLTGQSVTLTATVTGSGPTPTGTVSFLNDNFEVLTTATLDGTGHATTTYPFVVTTHLYPRYDGDANYGSMTLLHQENAIIQFVSKAETSLSLGLSPNPAAPGQQVDATLQLSITPPGAGSPPGTPVGLYTVLVDNVQVANVNVFSTPPIIIHVPNQSPGDHVMTVTYTDYTSSGNQNAGYYDTSAGPVTLHVNAAPAATTTTATASGTMINVTVSAPGATPTGIVTIANGATQLGSASLNGSGQTTINIASLPPGSYTLTVTYAPSGNFIASSATVGVSLNFSATSGVQFAFASGTSLTLDLFIPTQGAGPFPLIVAIDANDWSAPNAHSGVATREANRGYAVATIGFRSSDLSKFPAQIADVKAAVRWLRANAARYNLDPNRFGVWGIGAGGHLAALLGTSGGAAISEDPSEGNPAYSSRVQAVVDWYGQTDFLQLNAESAACSGAMDHDASTSAESRLLGCAIQSCSAAASFANPISYISGDEPPFLIMHGSSDCVVPAMQSQLLYSALAAEGTDARLQLIGGGHGDAPWAMAATLEIVDAFFDAKLRSAVPPRTRPARH